MFYFYIPAIILGAVDLLRTLVWIVESANLSQLSADDAAQIHHMIHPVHRFHIEDGRNIIAIDNVLLDLYALDERKDARQKTHDRLTACKFRHQRPLKRYGWCEGHGRQVFARETMQITLHYRYVFRSRHLAPLHTVL